MRRLGASRSHFVPRRGSHDDKAHPPIHPTGPGLGLSGDESKVYEFIVRRYLACISDDAKGVESNVELSIGSETFSSKGSIAS